MLEMRAQSDDAVSFLWRDDDARTWLEQEGVGTADGVVRPSAGMEFYVALPVAMLATSFFYVVDDPDERDEEEDA